MNNRVNAIIDAICVIMVLIVLASNLRQKNRDGNSKFLNLLMICVSVVLMADIPAWMLDGIDFDGAREICLILDTIYYLAQIVYCRLWLFYVDYWINGEKNRATIERVIYSIPMMVEVVLIFGNIFTGWIFTISDENVYSRGGLYMINLIPYYFYIIVAVVFALYNAFINRKSKKLNQSLSILIYMFLPICGAIIESIGYGLSWLWPFTAISLLMIFMNLQTVKISDERISIATQSEESARLENELADSRIKIMLTQIQPHFLYNSLSVIQALCDIDPDVAAKATGDFSMYLRCNMASLNTVKTIPFDYELNHTERYLSLEKLRFQERLNIKYNIQTKDFMIPALSLQPIVENAVRYGITKREEGGTLTISSFEGENEYIITVEDDGVGFDTTKKKNDDRAHIGIANVRKRIESMCGGKLVINSVPGVGTKAELYIPKNGDDKK